MATLIKKPLAKPVPKLTPGPVELMPGDDAEARP